MTSFHLPLRPPPHSVLLEHPQVPTSMLKNAGLAHVHLVQSSLVNAADAMPEPSADLFGSKVRARLIFFYKGYVNALTLLRLKKGLKLVWLSSD